MLFEEADDALPFEEEDLYEVDFAADAKLRNSSSANSSSANSSSASSSSASSSEGSAAGNDDKSTTSPGNDDALVAMYLQQLYDKESDEREDIFIFPSEGTVPRMNYTSKRKKRPRQKGEEEGDEEEGEEEEEDDYFPSVAIGAISSAFGSLFTTISTHIKAHIQNHHGNSSSSSSTSAPLSEEEEFGHNAQQQVYYGNEIDSGDVGAELAPIIRVAAALEEDEEDEDEEEKR